MLKRWLDRRPFEWFDKWVGNDPVGDYSSAVLAIKHLVYQWHRRVDLHKMLQADAPNCFHTHPAWAVRIVLAGGYEEEVIHRHVCGGYPWVDAYTSKRLWLPGNIGLVAPSFTHRISGLVDGTSYSLWLRGPIVAEIYLVGFDAVGNLKEEMVSHTKED